MKPILILAAFFLLQSPLYAQSFVANFSDAPAGAPIAYREYRNPNRVVSATTKVGIATAVAGATVFFIGRGQLNNNINTVSQAKQGLGLYFGGLAGVALGLSTAVGGGIHDVLKAKREGRFGVIYTPNNEIGVAYKF